MIKISEFKALSEYAGIHLVSLLPFSNLTLLILIMAELLEAVWANDTIPATDPVVATKVFFTLVQTVSDPPAMTLSQEVVLVVFI